MKVLHVIPSIAAQSGGPAQAILPMCRALIEEGVETSLATTDADLADVSGLSYERMFTHQGVPLFIFRKQLGASYKYSRPFQRWLDENVDKYDLVHIHSIFNHACIAAARACRNKHVDYIVRPLGTLDPWSMKQKRLRKKLFWHSGVKKMLTSAAAIHYTSKVEKHSVEESLGLNHGVVVPLGVDINAAAEFEAVAKLPKSFSFFPESPYVLVLSRLVPTKGLDVLVDAFLSLVKRREFGMWRLVLAGEGPAEYVNSLRNKVNERGASGHVVFAGWLDGDEKDAALKNASVFALPSQHENFGLGVMESLACGVPVLISPQVNLAPEIEGAMAGWIADTDKLSIERVLAEALSSKQDRLRRGDRGRDLARKYTWRNVAAQLAEIYSGIVSKSVLDNRAGVANA